MGLSNRVAGQVKYNSTLEKGTSSDFIHFLFPLIIPSCWFHIHSTWKVSVWNLHKVDLNYKHCCSKTQQFLIKQFLDFCKPLSNLHRSENVDLTFFIFCPSFPCFHRGIDDGITHFTILGVPPYHFILNREFYSVNNFFTTH